MTVEDGIDERVFHVKLCRKFVKSSCFSGLPVVSSSFPLAFSRFSAGCIAC